MNDANPVKVLVVGCGHMGASHAHSYEKSEGFRIVGLVSRTAGSREALARKLGRDIPLFENFQSALEQTRPDAVSINTYPDTHAAYAVAALNAGCHVFLEKPLAENIADAERVLEAARKNGRKLVVGYILHHHPAVTRFLEIGRTLGKPLVMRMNLNQQSAGPEWETHKQLMESCSPIVDCGVHYVDLMCQVTGARPVRVHAIGARLSDEIGADMYNYGQLQVTFEDGSVGWYEAGWGPMMSEEAHFIKDLIGPRGSVTIVQAAKEGKAEGSSSDVDGHTQASTLLVHRTERDAQGVLQRRDERIQLSDDPSHQDLCDREQAFFLRTIRENLDLEAHHKGVLDSMRIVLAADESWRTGSVVKL
jgi:predicted dehydrogenase